MRLKLKSSILTCLFFPVVFNSFSQSNGFSKIKLGAYYFDGWTGKTSHVNEKLRKFVDRAPTNGWITSTPLSVKNQINQAADAGISFFNFCWYFNGKNTDSLTQDFKNNALGLYLQSPNKMRLDFSIMVANHEGYTIKKEHWEDLTNYWCKLFMDPSYLRVEGKPIITFFSLYSLIETFKSSANVKFALDQFRRKASNIGINKIYLAVCIGPDVELIKLAERCGFDILTSYNNHEIGLKYSKNIVEPVGTMIKGDLEAWETLKKDSKLPQIPCVTLNWDRRPWDKLDAKSSRFSGYSGESVELSIKSCYKWISNNKEHVLSDRIAFVFAWNEYGEGSWLTPSRILGVDLLLGVKRGIKK